MLSCITRICEPLLRFLWPSEGRHRSPRASLPASPVEVLPAVALLSEPMLPREDNPLVRPYFAVHEPAHERREEAWRQRAPRRALGPTVHGLGIEPRLVLPRALRAGEAPCVEVTG